MLKKIKEFFYKPKTHNPEDFKVRLVPIGGLIYFEYTANGGKNWDYIYWSSSPFVGSMDYDWEWTRVRYLAGNLHENSFASELNRFSSYQKILDYEKSQREEFEREDKKHRAWREDYYKNKQETIDKINSR